MANYQGYKELLVEKVDKVLFVKFNNPAKKNCVNRTAYEEITRALLTVTDDDSITVVVFTGVGEYFTSGNDLSQFGFTTDVETYVKESNIIFRNLILAFVDCPKVIISVVNGPTIGVGATFAGLSDIVWCSETAYFLTPFTKLGIVPEACSSYLFPLILGRSKASEMLYFGEKLSAEEAYKYNFVSRIFKLADLDTVIWPKIKELSLTPAGALLASKRLVRLHERDSLIRANIAETDELYNRFFTEEFVEAVMQFAMRKKSSKL